MFMHQFMVQMFLFIKENTELRLQVKITFVSEHFLEKSGDFLTNDAFNLLVWPFLKVE